MEYNQRRRANTNNLTDPNQPGPSNAPDTTPSPVELYDPTFDDLDFDELFNQALPEGTGSAGGDGAINSMDVDPSTVQSTGAGGRGTGAVSAHSLNKSSAMKFLPRSKSDDGGRIVYKKSRLLFSYGYANANISQHKIGNIGTLGNYSLATSTCRSNCYATIKSIQ